MANMFNEDGTYNKTEWKAGDKITAVKLNIFAINYHSFDLNVGPSRPLVELSFPCKLI